MGNRETAFNGELNMLNDETDVNKMNLSLNGCGYLGIYHVGVCSCFRKYYPEVLTGKISGGSVGALVASTFMCEVPLSIAVKYVFEVSMKVRSGVLGPMSPNLNIMNLLYDRMDKMLPPDAHIRCNERLNVSVTRFHDSRNVLLKQFKTREELLQVLMCSCFIPIYCGYELPTYEGTAYVDAALSNNSPKVDEHTVTVAPFSGKSDICPENDGWFLKSVTLSNTSIQLTRQNLYMMFRVLFPGTPEMQREYCQQGYNDALRFLRDRGLVACPGCGAVGKTNDHSKCGPVKELLPKEITDEFDRSIQSFRRDLKYRLMQYKSLKFLYYINIPSIVTAQVAYTAASMMVQTLQRKAGSRVENARKFVLQHLKERLDFLDADIQEVFNAASMLQLDDSQSDEDSTSVSDEENPSDLSTRSELNDLNKSSPDVEIRVPKSNRKSDQVAGAAGPSSNKSCSNNGLNDLNKETTNVQIHVPQRNLMSDQVADAARPRNDGSFTLNLNVFENETQVAVEV